MDFQGQGADIGDITEVIKRAYKIREKMFVSALERVVMSLSNDRIAHQMLKSPTSQNFIGNRVQEVFEQIICDDREAYIAKIISKLEAYDAMYKDEQQEIVKALGTKYLKQFDQPKRGTIQRISHIHALVDMILKLRADMERIQSDNIENAKLLQNSKRKTRIDYTPSSPTFMHVFGEVDLTEMSKTMHAMDSENNSLRDSFEILRKNTSKIIRLMRSKTTAAVSLHNAKIEKMSKLLKKEKSSLTQMQTEFTGQMEQLKTETQAKTIEIENLRKILNSKQNVEIQLNNQKTRFEQDMIAIKQENEDLKSQNSDYEAQINALRQQYDKLSKNAEKFKLQNEEYTNEIKQQTDAAAEFENRLKNITVSQEQLKKNLAKEQQISLDLKIKLEEKTSESVELGKKLELVNQDLQDAQTKYAASREENQALQHKIQELQDHISSITNHLEKAKLQVDDAKLSAEEQSAQRQTELRNIKKLYSAMQSENAQQTELINQQKKQIDDLTGESTTLRKKLNDANMEIKSKWEFVEQRLTSENQNLKERLQQTSDQVNNLNKLLTELRQKSGEMQHQIENYEDQMNEKNAKLAENKDVIEKLRQSRLQSKDINTKLEDENSKLTREKSDLMNQMAIMKAQIQRITIKQNELQGFSNEKDAQNADLKIQNQQLQSDISDILSHLGVKTVKGALQEIENGKRALASEQNLRESLGISIRDDVNKKVNDLNKILQRIYGLLGTNDISSIENLKQEYDLVGSMVKNTRKPSDGVAQLISIQGEASDFVSQVISSLTGNPMSPKGPLFPMNPARNAQIIGILKKTAEQAKNDHNTVDTIVERAIGMGYTGDDGIEAVDFIMSKVAIEGRQAVLEQMSAQLSDVRAQLAKENQSHKEEMDQKIKELAESRKAALQLSQKNKVEREELLANNVQLEQRIAKLNEELNLEKSLRKELSRVGAGMSADKKLLKSKLSSQEYRLIELVEKLVKSERESRAIHDNMKKIREENLGAFV
ncbi:hypothetical protein TVAG_007290 [Trichomonas vaginalis G3]|uniref:Uncharacterized protein n=1 Tax=Trichomonas vaginalis (strain ATCC PRA-98 / G3) TaxID=412133 RepID=A2F4J0_TRIV3|nr:hypothetical protein TVAGG3_0422170 [Trichomonas vaginalis G3]EAY00199.1 hypothetical protein TVAG_007290 [Trichomonas vaginalis G3]KAI5536151.1 hypothetical protein TVAGG3_0422170 [Trichomonas vaginalis G3]|eukprot:XP_001313128.1 hypothetical protein [Trichomonas vaginalis G3]